MKEAIFIRAEDKAFVTNKMGQISLGYKVKENIGKVRERVELHTKELLADHQLHAPQPVIELIDLMLLTGPFAGEKAHALSLVFAALQPTAALDVIAADIMKKTQTGHASDNGGLFRILHHVFANMPNDRRVTYYASIMPHVSEHDAADFCGWALGPIFYQDKKTGKLADPVSPNILSRFQQALKARMAQCEAMQNNGASLSPYDISPGSPTGHYWCMAELAEKMGLADYAGADMYRYLKKSGSAAKPHPASTKATDPA